MKKIISALFFLLFSGAALADSTQLAVVITSDWDATTGTLQRYERTSEQQTWQKVGASIPVVVGKNGLAWGAASQNHPANIPVKQEGDGRTPAGFFLIGPGFGFDEKPLGKLDYFPLTETSVCVDDVKSGYYNQLLDSAKVPKVDWTSSEQMRQVPQYKMGSMVQYNTQTTKPGAGSCIFLHIWKSPTSGTAGCIAMDETNLTETLHWLDSRKTPMIAILTKPLYTMVKDTWKLPKD